MKYLVKFYSVQDRSVPHYLPRALKLVKTLRPTKQRYTLNEILELYNVSLFIEAKVYFKAWTKAEKKNFIGSENAIKRIIHRYFGSMDKNNFVRRTAKLAHIYQEDFLKLYASHRLDGIMSEKQFARAAKACAIPLTTLLKNSYIVNKYTNYLKRRLLSSPKNAEILLEAYVIDGQDDKGKLSIPTEVSEGEKSDLIEQYIDSKSPNYNYLQQINVIRNNPKQLVIPDPIRLKAKERLQAEESGLFAASDNLLSVQYKVKIDKEQDEIVVQKGSGTSLDISYSGKWLKEKMDPGTVLNNFIHVFEFVDKTMRIVLTRQASELGILERISMQAVETYQTGIAFETKETFTDATLHIYYNFLNANGKSLEYAIKWFYSTCLKQEFGINNFAITMPSKRTTWLEKCRLVVTELESIAKQYTLYVQHKEINHDLLEISSRPLRYASVPSLVEKKYIYPKEESQDVNNMLYYLFSDQSGLGYVREDLSEPTLFDLLSKNPNIKYNDFANYQRDGLKYLIGHNLLKKDTGIISIGDKTKVRVLSDIYQKGFVAYSNIDIVMRKAIDAMVGADNLRFASKDTLLSSQEADYFDYYLNRKFTNGPNLRNSYSHGSQSNSKKEDVHKKNYMTILKLLILLTIKINDELCYVDTNHQ